MSAATLNYNQQRSGHGRAGEPVAAMNRAHICADQSQPAESKAAVLQRLGAVATKLSRPFIELRGGRHSHRRQAGTFLLPRARSVATSFRRGVCASLTEIALARVYAAALLTDEQIAALLSPVLPADQAVTVEAGISEPVVQPPHHLERSSVPSVAMTNRDRKGIGSVQKSVGVFQHVGG